MGDGRTIKPLGISCNMKVKISGKCIPMEDQCNPVVDHQRRLTHAMQEVVKKEVIKLLDVGIIYPVPHNEWVSPVHCVPKKGGLTVVRMN
jgi:hypothetical protein